MRFDKNRSIPFQEGFHTSREDTVDPLFFFSLCLKLKEWTCRCERTQCEGKVDTQRTAHQGGRQNQVLEQVFEMVSTTPRAPFFLGLPVKGHNTLGFILLSA